MTEIRQLKVRHLFRSHTFKILRTILLTDSLDSPTLHALRQSFACDSQCVSLTLAVPLNLDDKLMLPPLAALFRLLRAEPSALLPAGVCS